MFDPKRSATTGYHLFIEPKDALREKLQSLIDSFAEEYGSPRFAPHVTLLARIPGNSDQEVIETAKTLAAALAPVQITLGALGMEDAYYRALYIRIQEKDTVTKLYQDAAEAFSMMADDSYLPHLSLLYGNYSLERKQESAQRLPQLQGERFIAESLHVYRTEGEVGKWGEIGVIPFG